MPDALNPANAYANLIQFLETGGDVLIVIMVATFFLWAMIIERFYFFATGFAPIAKRAKNVWGQRTDHKSWYAHAIRERLISEARVEAERSVLLIKTMVAVTPLLGLLGTVTGMIEVFDSMAATGSSNARAMASGVSKATIPTMAGMVASISGVFFSNIIDRRARKSVNELSDDLLIE